MAVKDARREAEMIEDHLDMKDVAIDRLRRGSIGSLCPRTNGTKGAKRQTG
ncbi:hypothetical protein GCM10009087_21680 [Sphingomonas oligophenolica]